MATTNLEVITDALRDLNVIGEIESPSAEQGAHALRQLNDLLEAWTEDGIDLGYFEQSLTTADCPIPKWSERGVKAKLSEALAPTYGVSIGPELARKIADGYAMVLRKTLVEAATPADMSHMPTGSGRKGIFDIESGGF
jgi:hypothetical protein